MRRVNLANSEQSSDIYKFAILQKRLCNGLNWPKLFSYLSPLLEKIYPVSLHCFHDSGSSVFSEASTEPTLQHINMIQQSESRESHYMAKDRAIGAALVLGAAIGIIIYGFLMFYNVGIALLVLKITAFLAVLAMLAILGWIGYVMATTPPPVPLEPEPASTPEKPSEGQQASTAENKSQP